LKSGGVANSLAELLQAHRSSARISQEALAERAGLSTRTISDIETGFAQTPRLITLVLLSDALGLSEQERTALQAAGRRRAPQVPAAAHAATIVPERLIPLVGRDDDAARLAQLVTAGEARLVTLVGPAGVGKTSLALRVAHELESAFEDGSAFVELAATREPARVPDALAKAFGVRESGGQSAGDSVIAYLAGRAMLVALDNFEHLSPAAAWIGRLLSACPRISIIVTSRQTLHLRSEILFSVQPLRPADARQLFVQRARSVKPEFALTTGTSAPIATIVEHLEGLPLAIELAAAQLTLLPAKALAARLERRLPLLGGGPIDAPQRQQTMHGAIAWSYDLLSPSEQALFRQLGIFRGGVLLDAARTVLAQDDASQSFLQNIVGLVDKSLISVHEDREGEPRIAILELLREFALERLVEAGELGAARERLARYALQFATAYEADFGTAQGRALARLEVEHANLLAALEWALEGRDADVGLLLSTTLWRFWWMKARFSEGVGWLRRFLALAEEAPQALDLAMYAKTMRGIVALLSAAGDFNAALPECEAAIARLREANEAAGLASLLNSLGTIQQFRGEFERAETAHREALDIRRSIGNDAAAAASLSNLASVVYTRGDIDRASTYANESVAIYRRLGNETGLAHALIKIGLVAAHRGELERADAAFEECLRIHRSLGDDHGSFYALTNLGALAHKRGEMARAIALHREALEIGVSSQGKAALAKVLEDIAVAIGMEDPARAVRILGAAASLRSTIGSPLFPAEQADYDRELERLRAALGAAAFSKQWHNGEFMSIDRAVEEAQCEPTAAGTEA